MIAKTAIILIGIFVVMPGCARLVVKRITDRNDTRTQGVRYYRPYPYLMVSEAKEEKEKKKETAGAQERSGPREGEAAKLELKIIYLPDFSHEYVMQPRAGFGVVDFKPTLENGWNLVALDAKVDSKTSEVIQAIAGLIEKAAKAGVGNAAAVGLKPGVYRLVYDSSGKLTGVDLDNPIIRFEK